MVTVLLVIGILVLLIVAHELGHFIVSKLCGVRVIEFGIGYPPRAFLICKIGDTEYTLNWIPFGGFVRLYGDEGDGAHGPGALVDSARWKQALILIAGVTMNLLVGWLLFAGAYTVGILHPVEAAGPGVKLIVSDVVAGSPADAAGIKPGDYLIKLSDMDGTEAVALTPDEVLTFVSARAGQELDVTYLHMGATSTSVLRPAHAVVPTEAGRAAIGIGLVLVTTEALSWKEASIEAYYQTKGTLMVVADGLWTIISGALHGAPNLRDVVGPVGLVSAVGDAASNGWGYILSLAGFISINLVIINLIPIPALDGGRLVIVILESALRRPAPRLAVQILNALGIALIIILMLAVTYNDIVRLLL